MDYTVQLIEFFATLKEFSIEIFIVGAVFFLIERLRPAEKKVAFFKADFWQEMGLAFLNFSFFRAAGGAFGGGGGFGFISKHFIPQSDFLMIKLPPCPWGCRF